jgi:two-component system, chemotaxis family, CheB/CheR fusion protein
MIQANEGGPEPGPPSRRFYVVGIGASAGGLEAFLELLQALPSYTGMAFVVVQHLEPNYESQLAEILSRATSKPVVQAEEGMRVEPDHVYVIPPNKVMIIRDGALHLAPRSKSNKPHYPIDIFFESLATDQGPSAIAVVLSGGASDGAEGIRNIKRKGGITFSQDEQSAKSGGMPHSAIATGAVDFVLPPARIAEELGRIETNPYLAIPTEQLDEAVVAGEADGALQKILDLVHQATGVDFSQYKQSTIRRRIGRRMVVHHFGVIGEYLEYLQDHLGEIDDLYRDLLISVTSFFREPKMFEALGKAISQYLETRSGNEPLRLWVPGCATGEEAYSIAITAFEILQNFRRELPLQLFGTDISESAIDRARAGVYSEKIESDISWERLRRFFARGDSGFRISQDIRESCVFARHDLTSDPPFSHMDLVSCRNVFIYLSSPLQQRVLPALHYSLKPGGLLVLGSAETIGNRADLFGAVDSEQRIYSKRSIQARFMMEPKSPSPQERFSQAGTPDRSGMPVPAVLDLETRSARILRDLYSPPGVLIDANMQVLHFHGQIGFYLAHAPDETTPNLLRLVHESLVYPLRKAVDSALATKQPVHESGIRVEQEGHARTVRLSVIPISDPSRSCLVLFEEDSPIANGRPAGTLAPSEASSGLELQLAHTERELAQTRDYLRKVVEQHEATTEELRAANEEARSSNEELQSTNEEIRTAKEELQSSNEELTTINDELKHRNLELGVTTNDLNNILNAATIPIAMVGMDLRLRRFTPAAERLLGLVSSDIGREISEIPHTLQLTNLPDMLLETIQTLGVQQRRVQDRQGRWYTLFVRPYRTIDDRIDGAVITLLDIHEAVSALEQAEMARKLADGIVETVQHPLLVLNSDLHVLRANVAFYKTFGVHPEDTLRQNIDDLGNGQWKVPELRRLLEQALLRDVPFRDLELTHEFPNIGRKIMRLNGRRISGVDGAAGSVLLAIEDVTDRQEAAEIQYRRLFESAKDGVIVLELPSARVIDVNPYLLELSRYPKAEFLGRLFSELSLFLDSEDMRRLVPETIEQGVTRYNSVPLRARDGQRVTVEIVSNAYRVKERSLIQVNIRDVTERRRSEETLRQSNLDLQQFAFAASHDLQEPLRTITSFLELFQSENEGRLGTKADEQIRHITTAAVRMRQLVLDLLGFSQAARADMQFTEVHMEAVLSGVIMNLQLAIENTHAVISFDSLPVVYADEPQMMRLLQNLIGNSIKYHGAEPPRIHISARLAGPEWLFSVKDNGIGIDPRYADQIFTVFKRLQGPEYPGTGIGLAVCKRIVERHGGRIWVESKPGEGATFYFVLPEPKQK